MKTKLFRLASVFIALMAFCFFIGGCSSDASGDDTTPEQTTTKRTVTYSTAHGTSPASITVDDGSALTSSQLTTLSAEGYTFGGWYVGSTKVEAGYKVTSNITFTAKWTAITYTVKFDANGGSGSIDSISATYDAEFEIPANSFTRSGYNASANTWNTSKDGSGTTLIAGSKAKNLTAENGATVTLYAIWLEQGSHSIIYLDSDGSAISGMSPSTFKETEDVDLSKAIPEKSGYTFAGWVVSTGTTTTTITGWKAGEKTSDVTLYAVWTADTNTAYTVKHYLQPVSLSTTLSDYEEQKSDEESKTGTTGTETAASAKSYAGFTAQEITQQTIAADSSTVVSVYYDRNEITLTLNLDGGSGIESLKGKYGTKVTAPSNPTKDGYTFSVWSPKLPETFPAENATYKALWNAEAGTDTGTTPYTVKHFLQNLALTSYKEQTDDRQTLTGTAGNKTSATAKTYAGFTAQTISQSTIAEDGSTVVSVYYDRNTVTLTFDTDGGSTVSSISGKYEAAVTAPANPTKTGYTFSAWSPEIPETSPAEDTTYTAIWVEGAPATYTVKHFLQDATLESYEEKTSDRQTLNGASGQSTSAAANSYAGFTAQAILQATISSDGSTVVSIYYDRNTITLTFDTDGGSTVDSISGKYGTVVTAPASPTKAGCTFISWSPEIPKTFPATDTTYTATWTANTLSSITASAPSYSSVENFLTVDKSNSTKITFTASDGYSSYAWYIDGDVQSETGTTFTMEIDGYNAGSYTVMLVVNEEYSATVEVAVSK